MALLAGIAQEAAAQQWDCSWIAHPAASDTAQVWFRRTYNADGKPREAYIDIASDGTYRPPYSRRCGNGTTPRRSA